MTRVRGEGRDVAVLDLLMAVCAIAGLAIVVLGGMPPVRTDLLPGTDFKTVYASAWCLAHGQDPFTLANLQSVFSANGVVSPHSWFSYAPVYPPFTLELLRPIASIGMVPAVWLVSIASAALLALAVAALMRQAAEEFHLAIGWRMLLATLCTLPPIVSHALTCANLSLPVAALSILAFVRRKHESPWLCGLLLALAILLKPHVAIWVAAAMFLLPERRARSVAIWSAGIALGFILLVCVHLAFAGMLQAQLLHYPRMLHAEVANGASMSPASHRVLPVVSQITSIHSLIGFWTRNPAVQYVLGAAVLLALAVPLILYTRRLRDMQNAPLAIAAWSALALLATYHRAYDAIFLLLLLPWLLDQIARSPFRWEPWTIAVLYGALCCGAEQSTLAIWLGRAGGSSFVALLVLRQAALAALALMAVLLVTFAGQQRRPEEAPEAPYQVREMEMELTGSAY